MRLTPPKKWVFWTSVILVVLGLVGKFVNIERIRAQKTLCVSAEGFSLYPEFLFPLNECL